MKGKWRDKEFEITSVGTSDGYLYDLSEVELLDTTDYWEKLKHKYAGMAMHGLLASGDWDECSWDIIAEDALRAATELVNKLKEEK